MLSCSAVSGRGVTELVRAVRALLDTLPEEEEEEEAEAEAHDQQTAAAAALPGRRDARARIGEFTIDCDLSGPRVWFVQVGTAGAKLTSAADRAAPGQREACRSGAGLERSCCAGARAPACTAPFHRTHQPLRRAPPSSALPR